MLVIYDDQDRSYYNPKPTDLDAILYKKNFVRSPNIHLGKFIVESRAGYKDGNYDTFEALLEYMNNAEFTIIKATKYCELALDPINN